VLFQGDVCRVQRAGAGRTGVRIPETSEFGYSLFGFESLG